MSGQDLFERALGSMHEAALGKVRWPTTAAAISEVTRTQGSALMFGEGDTRAEAELFFLRLCHGPERRTDLEQSYLRD